MPSFPVTPWYFDLLGIAPTEDVREIKRAYAVVLKKLDLETEQPAFERLRRALDLAQQWRAEETDEVDDEGDPDEEDEAWPAPPPNATTLAPASVVEVTPSPSAPASERVEPVRAPPAAPDPQQIAQAVDEWVQRARDANEDSADSGELTALLRQALGDPRLTHLDAQAAFEDKLVAVLRTHPNGAFDLFDAAARCFGWREDIHRLMPLSAPNRAWASLALQEEGSWRQQPAREREHQQMLLGVLLRLRPGMRDTLKHGADIARLSRQFPLWFDLKVPQRRLQGWEAAKARARRNPIFWVAARKGPNSVLNVAWVITLVMVLTTLCVLMLALYGPGGPLRKDPPASARVDFQVGDADADASTRVPTTSGPAGPALAYEFRGETTSALCGLAHQFAHESNWRNVKDMEARQRLEQRILDCVDKGMWLGGSSDVVANMLLELRGQAKTPTSPQPLSLR